RGPGAGVPRRQAARRHTRAPGPRRVRERLALRAHVAAPRHRAGRSLARHPATAPGPACRPGRRDARRAARPRPRTTAPDPRPGRLGWLPRRPAHDGPRAPAPGEAPGPVAQPDRGFPGIGAAHTRAGTGAAAHRGDPRAPDGQPQYVDAKRAAGLRDRYDRRPRLRVRRGRPVRLAGRPAPARPNPGCLRPQLRPAGTARIRVPAPAQQPARMPRTAPGPTRTHSGLPGPDLVRHRLDLLT